MVHKFVIKLISLSCFCSLEEMWLSEEHSHTRSWTRVWGEVEELEDSLALIASASSGHTAWASPMRNAPKELKRAYLFADTAN